MHEHWGVYDPILQTVDEFLNSYKKKVHDGIRSANLGII